MSQSAKLYADFKAVSIWTFSSAPIQMLQAKNCANLGTICYGTSFKDFCLKLSTHKQCHSNQHKIQRFLIPAFLIYFFGIQLLAMTVLYMWANYGCMIRYETFLKGYSNEADFLGFLHKLDPHRSLTLTFEPFWFCLQIRGDIHNQKRLPDSLSRGVSMLWSRRLTEEGSLFLNIL